MEKTQRQRFFATFFNANAEIVKNLNIPKARGAGEFVASYSEFSLNTSIGSAEGVVEYSEKIWSDRLEEHLAKQGAACITILTFANNDNNQSAGAALARVWKSAKAPGFELVTRGECNAKLLAKAEEITQEDESAESGPALDEKMQAAFSQSLTLQQEMKDCMATKDDLIKIDETVDAISFKMATKDDISKMDAATQQLFMSMKESLTAEFSNTITNQAQIITSLQESMEKLEGVITTKDRDVANQAQTIKELETVIVTKDRDNQTLADHNFSQRCVLARLNKEKMDDANQIKKLNEKIESKDKTILDLVGKNQILSPNNAMQTKLDSLDALMREFVDESRKRKAA